jgi:tetratricopeptide (TPR) repeat protein
MKRFSAVPKRLVLALALGVCVVNTPVVFAAAEEGEKRASAPTIDERTGRILTQAFEQMTADDNAGARATLQGLNFDRLSPYERSRVEQMLFSIEYEAGNFDGARQHIEAAIASGGLNVLEVSQLRYQSAQLYAQEEKWPEAARALEAWLSDPTSKATAANYYLLAIAYYQQELIDKALEPARKAVDMAETPQEPWLQLLGALLLQREDYDAALPVIEKSLNLFPGKKTYWTQLSSIYATKEDFANALVVLELANHAGLLTEAADLRRLSDMYMVRDMPYRAATLLQESIDKKVMVPDQKLYESLANALIASREFEKSLPVLEKAADLSSDGALYYRLGEVNAQLENWQATIDAFQKAMNKGGLRDSATPQLMTGISYYNLGKLSDARTWFERASSSANTKSAAQAYLQMIASKQN